MAIREHARLTDARPTTDRTAAGTEWTARSLHPVARWILVPLQSGRARLEMVWSTPDPQPSDAIR